VNVTTIIFLRYCWGTADQVQKSRPVKIYDMYFEVANLRLGRGGE